MSTPAGDEDRTVVRSGPTLPGSTAAASGGDPGGDAHALPVGTRLNEFELTQRIGEGGFSIVYLAWDHSLDRKVALKEYMPGALASRVEDCDESTMNSANPESVLILRSAFVDDEEF